MNTFCKCFKFQLLYPMNIKFSHSANLVLYSSTTVHSHRTYQTIGSEYITLPNLQFYRNKYSKKSQSEEADADSSEGDPIEKWDELASDKHSKMMSVRVGSLRADLILKASLGMARNKVETAFYESRIRINGKKIFKKSVQVCSGDEVDVIRGKNPMNPDFLTVSRIEVLGTTDKEEGYAVQVRRFKSLIIENYSDPWKQSEQE